MGVPGPQENQTVESGAAIRAVGEGGATRAGGVGYRPKPPFLDELFEHDGTPRSTAGPLVAALEQLGAAGLIEAGRRRDAIFMQQGITFETGGGEAPLTIAPSRWISFRGCSTARNGRASSAAWPSGSAP